MNPVRTLSLLTLSISLSCAKPAADPNIGDPIGRCMYVNGFTDRLECKEYLGSDWDEEAISADCADPVPGSDPGTYEHGLACEREAFLGQCFVDAGTVESATIVFLGEDPGDCGGLSVGCGFAGGEYVPNEVCGGEAYTGDPGPTGTEPFKPFERICRDPVPGEPPGLSAGGQVCTWQAISASTEAGRHFEDYAACSEVQKQRPYWADEPYAVTGAGDGRLADAEYMEEFRWVTAQVDATACVCCHKATLAPEGASGWHTDAEGIWLDGVDDDGLAMLAGWIDSTAFGAFDASDNNGFARKLTGLPSTDPLRMRRFLEAELARRGLVAVDFAGAPAFGGPLADQLAFEPEACADGVGIDEQGTVHWAGGPARYLYVLEAGASPPGVPPNLDLPAGTLWRVDVAWTDPAIPSGVSYGEVPPGSIQRWPAEGPAPSLVPGETYYLYVLYDIYQPLTRCLFDAP